MILILQVYLIINLYKFSQHSHSCYLIFSVSVDDASMVIKNKEMIIDTIQEIIRELKKQTKITFIKDAIQIKNSNTENMWYDSLSQAVVVSKGMLASIYRGYFDRDDIKVILAHEFGHAAEEPKLLDYVEWTFFIYIISMIILGVIALFKILIFPFGVWPFFFVIFVILTLEWCYYRRKWERIADQYVFILIEDKEKVKATFHKLRSRQTRFVKIHLIKPFYYFGFSLAYEERMRNLEQYEKK